MGALYVGKLAINFVAFIGMIIAGIVTIVAGVQATNVDTGMLRVRTTSIFIVGALLIVASFTPLLTALNWINMHRSSESRKAYSERAARQARWELMLDEDLLISGTSPREGKSRQVEPEPETFELGKEKYVTSEHEHIQITSEDPAASLNMELLDLDANRFQYRANSGRRHNDEAAVLGDESVKIAMVEQLVATRNK